MEHESATTNINQMPIRAECRQRAAESDSTTLRQLFDEVRKCIIFWPTV